MFEYDFEKSKINKEKHGIDFEEAKELWEDNKGIDAPANSKSEERFYLIAKSGDKMWTAIYTHRNENIRIISVRRSRKNEEEIYRSGGIR